MLDTLNHKVNVVSYVRFSSENQRDESAEAQLRAITSFCDIKKYKIIENYIDRAKSATTDKRPEFQRMIADAEKGRFDYILVHKLDRFSRDKYDSIFYKRKLKNLGVRVISVLENLDDTPESVILESVIEGMSEYYSKNLAREVKKGLAENAYQCKHTGGIPPLGYNIDPLSKKYIINNDEVEIVKLIYNLYLEDYTSGDIIRKLNELGYKTKKNVDWSKNSLQSILRNEKYTGTFIYNKSSSKDFRGKRNNHRYKSDEEIIRIENGLPIIIAKDDFERVKQKMSSRKQDPSQVVSKQTYLLSGLVKCECGHSMSGNVRRAKRKNLSGVVSKPEYVSYRCGCRKTKSTVICNNSEIRKEYLEEYVMSELEKMVISDSAINSIVEKVNESLNKVSTEKDEIIKRLEINRKETLKSIENIISAVTMGFASLELKDKLDTLDEKKIELEIKIEELGSKTESSVVVGSDIRKALKNLRHFLLTRDLVEVKKFMKMFVKSIIVTKEGIEVTFNLLSSFIGDLKEYDSINTICRKELYTPHIKEVKMNIPNKINKIHDKKKKID